jgi:dolichyl-phosphate-mannose--protein O-mannosyl transferase
VVAAFSLLWLLVGRMRPAVVGALLLMFDQMLFVLARIGMLDVFLGAFLLWALVAMLWAMRGTPGQVRRRWILAAILFGLAVGTKWAAIPYVALAGLAFLGIRLRDMRAKAAPHWPGLGTIPGLLILGTVSILTYCLTFLPAFFYERDPLTLAGLIPLQREMYALQTQVLARHTYQSDWWSWPLMLRPIWYFYEWDAGAQRGVLLIGNPVIMWGGLVAVLACLWAGFRDKARRPLALGLLWIASLALYVVIPKSIGFYYYYHLSGIFLCLVLAAAFHHFDRGRGKGREEWFVFAACAMYVYFYPILAASPLPNDQGFTYWMWFPGWR